MKKIDKFIIIILILLIIIGACLISYSFGKKSNTIPNSTPEQQNNKNDSQNKVPEENSFSNKGLETAFQKYKDGQISECTENGSKYYSASENAYDGGGQTFDVNGNAVGEYQGFTGKYTGVSPENCERIYVISPNIWGYPAVNKYNLK